MGSPALSDPRIVKQTEVIVQFDKAAGSVITIILQ